MTHYQLMDIQPDVEQAEIKPAYFAALRKYPPEQFPKEFEELRRAYEILSNEEARAQYDATLGMAEEERAGYQQAMTLYNHGSPAAAIKILTEAGEPASKLALSLLGDCYAENGNSQKAAKVFEKLVEQNPENAAFLVRLGDCYADRGWEKKAKTMFLRAVETDESEVNGWSALIQLSDPGQPETQTLVDNALAACRRHDRPTLSVLGFALATAALHESVRMADYVAQTAEQKSSSLYSDEGWLEFEENVAPLLLHYFLSKLQADEPVDFVPLKATLEQAFTFLTEEGCGESFATLQKVRTIFAIRTDEKISEFMEDFLNAAVSKDATALETANLEMYCLLNLGTHRAEIQYLKQAHPDAYAWKKSFFDRVLQAKNEDNLIEKCGAKVSRLAKENPEEARELFDDFELPEKRTPFVRTEPKVGRNDPCPCGSGKKYKKCCGR